MGGALNADTDNNRKVESTDPSQTPPEAIVIQIFTGNVTVPLIYSECTSRGKNNKRP
jgi:hypothetical protein